jgi:sulfate adenylyltransferase subunit 2
MITFRDEVIRRHNLKLIVHTNPDGIAQVIGPLTHGSAVHTTVMKTEALLF